jgi:hypothetical protein
MVMVQQRPQAKGGDPKAAAAEQAKEERRRAWLERADKEILATDAVEPQTDPERVAKRLDSMVEASANAEVLMPFDKSGIRDRVRLAKRGLYERHVDHLLDCAMAAAHDRGRDQEKNEILKQVNDKFAIAQRLGTRDEIKESVKQRLGIIRETSAAGISAKAKEDAEREAQRRETVYPNERRTFTRWTDPQLVVVIETKPVAKTFTTANWSLSGLLIEVPTDGAWKPGQLIEIKVGLTAEQLHPEQFEVVRHCPETHQLAVKSRRFASVLVQVKRDCDAAEMSPA